MPFRQGKTIGKWGVRYGTPEYFRLYHQRNRDKIEARRRARRAAARAEYLRLHPPPPKMPKSKPGRPLEPARPLPAPYQGHPLFAQARALGRRLWYGRSLYDADSEDELSEIVLALLEQRDPCAARDRWRAQRQRERYRELPLYGGPLDRGYEDVA